MIKFYDKLPDMECLAGDTSPVFNIEVETTYDLSECTMYMVLCKDTDTTKAVVSKGCVFDENVFKAQLTSTETAGLSEGSYSLYFSLHTPNELKHKKLYGHIYIRASSSE
jgi:hypothetical protein